MATIIPIDPTRLPASVGPSTSAITVSPTTAASHPHHHHLHRPHCSRLAGLSALLGVVCVSMLLLLLTLWIEPHLPRTEGFPIAGRVSNMEHCDRLRVCNRSFEVPPLLIISMDGFAARYLERGFTPNINEAKACGVGADYIKPSFPTKTFPNHYSIATGLYPGYHGIIDNRFYNHKYGQYGPGVHTTGFFKGEPIWNTVRKSGKEAKVYFWVGSEEEVEGLRPNEYKDYNSRVPFVDRVQQVLTWLQSPSPPALSMLYFEKPDAAGHDYGPDSSEVNQQLVEIDATFALLLRKLEETELLGCVNIVLVSDHGMRNVDTKVDLEAIAPKLSKNVTFYTGNVVNTYNFTDGMSYDELRCKEGEQFMVYDHESIPHRYYFQEDPNVGFPFIVGNPGIIVEKNAERVKAFRNKGNHGWDNSDPQMRALFMAIGPDFKQGYTTKPFFNTELYNLFTDLLKMSDVRAANNGSYGLLHDLLLKPQSLKTEKTPAAIKNCAATFTPCFGQCNKNIIVSSSSCVSWKEARSEDLCVLNIEGGSVFIDEKKKKAVLVEAFIREEDLHTSLKADPCFVVTNLTEGCSPNSADLTSLIPGNSAITSLTDGFLNLPDGSLKRMIAAARDVFEGANGTVRLWAGPVFAVNGTLTYVFLAGLRCRDGAEWRKERDFCKDEEKIDVIAFLLPNLAEDFNCLEKKNERLLLTNHLSTTRDIERLTGFHLLPRGISQITRLQLGAQIADVLW